MKFDLSKLIHLVNPPKKRAIDLSNIWYKVEVALEEKINKDGLEKYYWLQDVFYDSNNDLFAIITEGYDKYKMSISLSKKEQIKLGDPQPVKQDFVAINRNNPIIARTNTKILRTADDLAGWFSISGVSTFNRSGSIDSQALFDSFINFAGNTGLYPLRTFYHLYDDQFITGQSNVLLREGNCYLTGGYYFDTILAKAEVNAIKEKRMEIGESIGFIPTSPPELIVANNAITPVYRSGVNFEIAALPENEAAHLFTQPINPKETRSMADLTNQQRSALAKLLQVDEEEVDAIVDRAAGTVNKEIEASGLLTRTTGEETPLEPKESTELDEEDTPEIEEDAELSTITEQLTTVLTAGLADLKESHAASVRELKEATLTQVSEALQDIDSRVAELEKRATGNPDNPRRSFNLGGGFTPTQQRGLSADAVDNAADVHPPATNNKVNEMLRDLDEWNKV